MLLHTFLFASLSSALSLPSLHGATYNPAPSPLPLLIWHGLGDKFSNPGLLSIGDLAEATHPGTKVHYIRVADTPELDQRGTFFGNISAQLDDVCASLVEELGASKRGKGVRVDALGFSQGGQFLRGLVERCPAVSVRSLVTFGSQHNGIAEFQHCGTWDLLCKGAVAVVGGNAWTDTVQSSIVPAQYYREINQTTGLGSEEYLLHSHFLADINNERVLKNEVYKERMAALESFVMYVFEEDTTVVPKESGWFAEVNATSGDVTPLRERVMYNEDWLGLRELDEKGGLVLRNTTGKHMELDEEVVKKTFEEFFGPERSKVVVAEWTQWTGAKQSSWRWTWRTDL
ncbi:hypothetical protein B0A48_16201 [Cryoendolithus antarcticus]|uniref:Palmitoyl-protein thioesterase 1 n=1 Tax=Cryoendolithus antarcticus TaxID=1507870 RepID=A0A1V8SFY2_9PEZI|nr:hypothetical protein B0A48_16201 [Cryoendolithus antarcticus]